MTVPRCFVHPCDWADGPMRLSPAEQHRLLHVLRAEAGDSVLAFDGRGREVPAHVTIEQGAAMLRPEGETKNRASALSLTLIQAVPKGPKMDWIVEKATELGVSTIQPVLTERCVPRLHGDRVAERHERWQRIALSAARQCGAPCIPEVRPPAPYGEAIARHAPMDLFLVGALTPDATPLAAAVAAAKARTVGSAGLLIGPEGDLTADEIRAAVDAGAVPVRFGPLVLKVETACLFGLSVLVYEFLRPGQTG